MKRQRGVCRCDVLEVEVGELRQHSDWQAQRIQELQSSATGQLVRKYDAEMQRLRAEFEAERRQLQADLAQARAGAQTKVGELWQGLDATHLSSCLHFDSSQQGAPTVRL